MLKTVILVLICCSLLIPVGTLAWEENTDRPGSDYRSPINLPAPDPQLCENACRNDSQCKAWTYVKPTFQGPSARCYLKNPIPNAVSDVCCTSGTKPMQIPTPPVIPVPQPVHPIITPLPIPPVFNPNAYLQLGMTNMVQLCVLVDCSPPPDPVIMSLVNAPIEPGKKLIIIGEGFMDDPGTVLLDSYFGAANREIQIDPSNWGGKCISVDIPGNIQGIVDHDAQIRVKTWDGRLSIAMPVRFKAAQELKRAQIRIDKCDSDFLNTISVLGEDTCEFIPPPASDPTAYIIFVRHFPHGEGHDKFSAGPWSNGYLFDSIDFWPAYDNGHAYFSIDGGGPGYNNVTFTVHWPDAVDYCLNVYIRGPKGLPAQ